MSNQPQQPDDSNQPAREVNAEIVPTGQVNSQGAQAFGQAIGQQPATTPNGEHWTKRTFFHPMSGLAIIGIDLMAFGGTAATGGLGIFFSCAGAFVVTLIAVTSIQMNNGGDSLPFALLKGFIGGVVAGLPFPIAGTFVGAAILMLSGLPSSPDKAMAEARKQGMGQ